MFRKYESIENHYQIKWIDAIKNYMKLNNVPDLFAIQEKIHGANFQIYYDGKEIRYGKRNGLLEYSDSFYGWQKAMEKYEFYIKRFYKNYFGKGILIIYGELYGPRINKGVNYLNKKNKGQPDFIAFDIKYNNMYLGLEFLSLMDIPYCKTIFTGTLDECLEYDSEFNSLLCDDKIIDNICEGIVIKPTKPFVFVGQSRMIVKKKNERFKEKVKAKKVPKIQPDFDNSILDYLNDNRIDSARSKEGEITKDKLSVFAKIIVEDIIEDYKKDNIIEDEKFYKKKLSSIVYKYLLKFI